MKNIMMDVTFTVETDKEFEELTPSEIVGGILRRCRQLLDHWEPEAIGFCDEFEMESKYPNNSGKQSTTP
jgi:hypothetical protein